MENIFFLIALVIVAVQTLIAVMICCGVCYAVHSLDIPKSKKARTVITASAVLTGWFFFSVLLAIKGFFRADDAIPVNVALGIMLPIIVGLILLRFSSTFRSIISVMPQHWFIGLQLYRCLGGIFLLLLAQQKLPAIFALPAGLGDLFVGVSAPVVAYWCLLKTPWASRIALIWNAFGIIDLAIAVGIGFFAAPGSQRLFLTNPSTEIMAVFPLVMIPIFAVPIAILLHLFSLRRLLATHR